MKSSQLNLLRGMCIKLCFLLTCKTEDRRLFWSRLQIQVAVWGLCPLRYMPRHSHQDTCLHQGIPELDIIQNHRMVGAGKDLWWLSSPTPLLKPGHVEHIAQDLIQVGLEYLQRRRLHNLPGQPAPGLCHPQREEVLPHVQTELPVLQVVPIAPCPVTGHHWKELGPILLTPTLQIFISIYTVPSQPSLLQAKQAQLPQPFLIAQMLQSPHTFPAHST